MRNATNKALDNMAKQLSGVSLSNNEIAETAKSAGIAKREGIISEGKYQDCALALHSGGVRLLKLSTSEGKKDPITNLVRDSFFAGMAGIKQESIKNAYLTFMDTVNTGKVHTDTNKSRSNSKGKKAKGGKTQADSDKVINAFKTIWQLSDAEPQAIEHIEAQLDKGLNLVDAIADFLTSEGITLESES